MNQTFAILTRVNRPLHPTRVVHVDAPTAADAFRTVALRNPGATIIGMMPTAPDRTV